MFRLAWWWLLILTSSTAYVAFHAFAANLRMLGYGIRTMRCLHCERVIPGYYKKPYMLVHRSVAAIVCVECQQQEPRVGDA